MELFGLAGSASTPTAALDQTDCIRWSSMNKQDFDGLCASVRQAGALRRGELKPSRVTEFPSADVKTVRQQLGTSHSRPSESKEME